MQFVKVRDAYFGWPLKAYAEGAVLTFPSPEMRARITGLVLGVDPAMDGSASLVAHGDDGPQLLGLWRWRPTTVGGQAGSFRDGGMYSAILGRKVAYAYLHRVVGAFMEDSSQASREGRKLGIPEIPEILIRIETQFINPNALNSVIPTSSAAGLWLGCVGVYAGARYQMVNPSEWRHHYLKQGLKGQREALKAKSLMLARMLFGIEDSVSLTDNDSEALLLGAIHPQAVMAEKKKRRKKSAPAAV